MGFLKDFGRGFLAAGGSVIRGTQRPVAKADRSGWKQPVAPSKPDPKTINTSVFANKENWTREKLAEEIIKRLGTTGVDKDLRNQVVKRFGRLPKSTDTKEQKMQLVDEIIGTQDEHIIGQDFWEKKVPQLIYRRKKMERDVREAGVKKDFAGQQKEKLQLEMYNRIIKGRKN